MKTLKTMDEVKHVTMNDFSMIIAKSHACGACQTITNVLEQNIKNLDAIEKHIVFIDDLDEFRGEYLIFSVPTVLIFSNGKELLRESRYIDYAKITRLIELYQS